MSDQYNANEAGRSEAVRDMTEPGWREREAERHDRLKNAIPELSGGAPGKLGDGIRGHDVVSMNFYKWWYEIGSGIVKLDTDDNEEHARRVAKEAWGFVMRQMVTEHGIAIARVIESDDFAAEVAWILNPLPPGTLLYEGPNAEVSGACAPCRDKYKLP